MSYTLDIYLNKIKPTDSLLKFALYVAFFPQLVAGPIIRASKFLPQLKDKFTIMPDNLKAGLNLVLWGLVKKMVIADNIAIFVDKFFADPSLYPGSFPVMLAAIGFAIQIYCDFSGYSDIAIGLARIMGINLPLNFNKPYFSKSMPEFWRKCHISLTTWFRDYVFFPIIGRKFTNLRVYSGTIIVFLVSGLWHGAGWNFVLWGFLHGSYVVGSTITRKWREKITTKIGLKRIPRFHNFMKVGFTFYLVVYSYLLFRQNDITNILYTTKKFFLFDFVGLSSILSEFKIPLIFMLVFGLVHSYNYFKRDILAKIENKGLFEWTVYLTAMALILYLFSPSVSVPFIYFQF